jgi:hypothetical protein
MKLLMDDKAEKPVDVTPENAVSKIEQKLENKDG